MQRAPALLRIAAVFATGTLAVCGVKAPPRPPLAEAPPDAGAAMFAECSPEAREAFATARFACGDEARMLPGCKVACATDRGDAGAPDDDDGAGNDGGALLRDGGSR